jgi:hypothetical protein
LDSDVVCGACIPEKPDDRELYRSLIHEMSRGLVFDTSQVTKNRYLPLSTRMKSSLKKVYKQAKR